MPRKAAGLTARKVETIKTPGLFADGNGLYLQVTASGARSWIYRFAMSGRRRDMGLGSAIVVSLAQARDKAIEAKKLVAAGVDPLEARKAQAAAQVQETAKAATFKECAVDFIEAMKAGWKNAKHGAQWVATLETYAFPVLGSLPVADIDTALVLQVLQPIWTTKTETASRLRGRIESVLDFAKVTGVRSGENPARWKGHLDLILPAKAAVTKVEHHASVPYSDSRATSTASIQAKTGVSLQRASGTTAPAAMGAVSGGAKVAVIAPSTTGAGAVTIFTAGPPTVKESPAMTPSMPTGGVICSEVAPAAAGAAAFPWKVVTVR